MKVLSLNNSFKTNYRTNKDKLSVFKKTTEKDLDIQQGMSEMEISEIVSEKLMAVIKEQFEATKIQYETKEKNKSVN